MNAQHSSASPEHYTPAEIIEAARQTMGGIDLDPATTALVNERTVKAERIYTREDDGLSKPWHGRVWLNPPGGKTKGKSNAAIWWSKLVVEWLEGRVEQAVFLGFSIEILATSQSSRVWVGDCPFCVPRRRIEFLKEGGSVGDSPTHANIIAFLPPRGCAEEALAVECFQRDFQQFGEVRV